MTTISAQTILRSRNAAAPDKVLSTLLLRYPRCIHSEFMTHRALSRNAASSRAIPVEKLIKDVMENPFVPMFWGKNQKGMQAGEECSTQVRWPDYNDPLHREESWLRAGDAAINAASAFAEAGYHKQIVNRLLEPFAHITTLVSATEWDNFLELRDHPDAEPHIQVLAQEIRKCLEDESTIQTLHPGQWHAPFVDYTPGHAFFIDGNVIHPQEAIKLSVARCASTSYKTVDGFDMTLERAIDLHDKLVSSRPIHASPAEHVAQADDFHPKQMRGRRPVGWQNKHQHANFVGFRQYRHMLPGG